MRRVTSYSFLAFVLFLSLAGLTGCNSLISGHSPAEPTVTSFVANPTTVTVGGSTSLTAVFSNGTGVITPGNLTVTSGTPVTVSPTTTTVYTLTVTPSLGTAITQTTTVSIQSSVSVNLSISGPAVTDQLIGMK